MYGDSLNPIPPPSAPAASGSPAVPSLDPQRRVDMPQVALPLARVKELRPLWVTWFAHPFANWFWFYFGFVAALSQRIGAAAGPISVMALLAAIVVVTNTVLVSVTQRTREIGVRRALGARASRIVQEILAESLLLSVAGGTAGALGAWLLLATLEYALDLPLHVAPRTLAMAMSAAAGSGIVSAWYPATRAVALDVVSAIRAE